jgi:ABC-type transporter Mla subunit MlaD
MRLKDLHADQKTQITTSLQVESDAFRAMQAQVEQNDTTLARLYDTLCSAQQRIDRLAVLVARLADQEVPR